jgi:hypothetical protein
MFQAHHNENDDIEFKFIHIFKRIETCEKWTKVMVAPNKEKDVTFDPTSPMPAAGNGCLTGHKKAKLARDAAPMVERLQSCLENSIAGVTSNVILMDEKFDARWVMMFEKQDGR